MEPMMTAILICVFAFGVLGVIFMIRLLMDVVDTRAEIRSLRAYINDVKKEMCREHEYTQDTLAEAVDKLDILVTPVEERFVESVKKMYDKVNEEG